MLDLPFLPSGLFAWCLLAALLGVRHGLEADHLATIDALARLQSARRRATCGLWFALGHGAVVAAMAVAAAAMPRAWQWPPAAALAATVVSAALLLGLGVANLAAVLATPAGGSAAPVGLKGRVIGHLMRWLVRVPPAWAPCVIGAALGVSADTLAVAALFGLGGAGGPIPAMALVLAGAFTLGMAVVDGLDGWWLARLLERSDALAARAARAMGLAVAALGLTMGTLMLCRLAWPWLDERLDGAAWLLSAAALLVLAGAYALASRLARRGPALVPG